jgi:hypothetical protein
MNIPLIFGGIVKMGGDLSKIRIDAEKDVKETPNEEIDLEDGDKEYEDDDEDDDFDDADEELEAIENDDLFRYESPTDNQCPLIYLKYLLGRAEKEQPEYFKILMDSLKPDQVQTLLHSINFSEEYLSKLHKLKQENSLPESTNPQ